MDGGSTRRASRQAPARHAQLGVAHVELTLAAQEHTYKINISSHMMCFGGGCKGWVECERPWDAEGASGLLGMLSSPRQPNCDGGSPRSRGSSHAAVALMATARCAGVLAVSPMTRDAEGLSGADLFVWLPLTRASPCRVRDPSILPRHAVVDRGHEGVPGPLLCDTRSD